VYSLAHKNHFNWKQLVLNSKPQSTLSLTLTHCRKVILARDQLIARVLVKMRNLERTAGSCLLLCI